MFSKVFCFIVLVSICAAWPTEHDHGHHGHAISSQNIVRHDIEHHEPHHHHEHEHDHHDFAESSENIFGHDELHDFHDYEHEHGHEFGVSSLNLESGDHHEPHHHHHEYAVSSQNVERHDVEHHEPHHEHGHEHHHDTYAPPHYKFEYSVKDPHTGDNKHQWESRKGDHVNGGYMLVEADGSIRTVEYTADKHSGFHAHVHRHENIHPTHYHHHD